MPWRYSKKLGRRVWQPYPEPRPLLTRDELVSLKHLKAIQNEPNQSPLTQVGKEGGQDED